MEIKSENYLKVRGLIESVEDFKKFYEYIGNYDEYRSEENFFTEAYIFELDTIDEIKRRYITSLYLGQYEKEKVYKVIFSKYFYDKNISMDIFMYDRDVFKKKLEEYITDVDEIYNVDLRVIEKYLLIEEFKEYFDKKDIFSLYIETLLKKDSKSSIFAYILNVYDIFPRKYQLLNKLYDMNKLDFILNNPHVQHKLIRFSNYDKIKETIGKLLKLEKDGDFNFIIEVINNDLDTEHYDFLYNIKNVKEYKEFIIQNLNLINDSKWRKVREILGLKNDGISVREYSQNMTKINIDALKNNVFSKMNYFEIVYLLKLYFEGSKDIEKKDIQKVYNMLDIENIYYLYIYEKELYKKLCELSQKELSLKELNVLRSQYIDEHIKKVEIKYFKVLCYVSLNSKQEYSYVNEINIFMERNEYFNVDDDEHLNLLQTIDYEMLSPQDKYEYTCQEIYYKRKLIYENYEILKDLYYIEVEKGLDLVQKPKKLENEYIYMMIKYKDFKRAYEYIKTIDYTEYSGFELWNILIVLFNNQEYRKVIDLVEVIRNNEGDYFLENIENKEIGTSFKKYLKLIELISKYMLDADSNKIDEIVKELDVVDEEGEFYIKELVNTFLFTIKRYDLYIKLNETCEIMFENYCYALKKENKLEEIEKILKDENKDKKFLEDSLEEAQRIEKIKSEIKKLEESEKHLLVVQYPLVQER